MIDYNHNVRTEIEALLPERASRIVDVGCASGATLAWLRHRFPDAYTIGLEGNPALREELRGNVHEAHICNLNGDIPQLGAPDLILFLDVLEHLPDPVSVLARISACLAPGGSVIVSLPNVAHVSVALPLILFGQFSYKDAGILDRTHMRFFVQKSALQLMTDAGLEVDGAYFSGMSARRWRLLDGILFGTLRTRTAQQFILRGRRGEAGGPMRLKWGVVK